MQKSFLAVLLLVVAGLNKATAQLAQFSFAGPSTVSGWTNIPGDPYTGVRAATVNGITISSISTSNWAPNSVPSAEYNFGGAQPGVYFPDAVMQNSWLQYNGSSYNLALYNAAVPQLQLSGLNKDSTYILRMTGNDKYYTGNTQYTVVGLNLAGSQQLNTYNNTTQGITFTHVQPDASGTIRIYVNATSNALFAFISGVQVFPGSANVGVPVIAMTAPVNGTNQSEGGNLVISATASETGGSIAKVEFYADTTKIGEADAAPYTMTWVDPDPASYQITAKATDAIGTIASASVNVKIQSLNYFWSTTGNIATSGDSSFVGTVDTNRLSFRTNNVERMTILKDGTIGIGTKNTYGYLLAVNGTAIFTKAKIKTAGTWPDYVFKKEYVLPGLEDLEKYLVEHHHLPGVPSELDVQRDGIDIGDQQAALLKQVEELTLYLIRENRSLTEQNRQLGEQNAQLAAQQKEIDELKAMIQVKK